MRQQTSTQRHTTPEEWLYTVLPSAQPSGRPSLSHMEAKQCSEKAGSPADSVQVCFSAFLRCQNAPPEITPNPSATGPKINISLSSIDPCPPFRPERPANPGTDYGKRGSRRDLYIEKPLPRAWSRMTGVGNSLKLSRISENIVFLSSQKIRFHSPRFQAGVVATFGAPLR